MKRPRDPGPAASPVPAQTSATASEVFAIAWPMMLAYCSVPLMGLIGVGVMGHLDHPKYLAGVGLSTNFFAFFYFVFAFLRWSTTGLAAQASGRAMVDGDNSSLADILLRSLTIGAALGVALVLLRAPLLWVVLPGLTDAPELRDEAGHYAAARVFGAPALLGSYALSGWFIGSHRPRAVLWMTLAANVTNAGLLLLFVQGFGGRSASAGAAAAIAEWTGLAVGLVMALRTGLLSWHGLDRRRLWARPQVLALFRANGNVLVKTLFTIAIFFAFLGISGRLEAAALAANLLLLQLFYLASYALDGFANACEALSGRAEGAGHHAEVWPILRLCLQCALAVAGVFALTYAMAGHAILSLMSDQPAVVAQAQQLLPWMVLVPLVQAGATVFDGVFVGTLRLDALRNSAIAATMGFGLLATAAVPLLGNHGLWLSFAGYFVLRQLVAWWLFRRLPRPSRCDDGAA